MTAPGISLGAVIVAAGAGRRLGGVAKALLPRGDVSYLATIAATARAAADLGAVIVVVGPPFGDAVAAHAAELGLGVAENPAPGRGMASSIAIGFAALAARAPALGWAWLWPVDHPAVRAATLRQLAAAADVDVDVVQPRHRGAGGHPPLCARSLWPALAACGTAADGARGVLRAARVRAVEVDDPGVVRDVDT
ncbi:MAG TPA: NTP transferase domain-containing protein, partial [Kofleriaceae bacterium]